MTFVYWWTWKLSGLFYKLFLQRRVYHPERVPRTGAAILASNHASFFDPPLVGSSLPRDIHYLGRNTLFTLPVIGWFIRKLNTVPVDRDGGGGAGLKAIFERLKRGAAILLFPEGTRTEDGRLQPARSGIGLVVIKSDAPVIPVRLWGSYEAWPKGKLPWLCWTHQVQVKFGKPMDFSALRAEARTCSKDRLKEIYQQVADEIMREIGRLRPGHDSDDFF